MTLGAAGYYEVPAANVLVFSNWYDGLFADSKISGVEIIQQGTRIGLPKAVDHQLRQPHQLVTQNPGREDHADRLGGQATGHESKDLG